jgi:hypothetical protein
MQCASKLFQYAIKALKPNMLDVSPFKCLIYDQFCWIAYIINTN